MSLLRIHIPSSWPDLEPAAPLPWCRLGARGEWLDAGSATLVNLPRAEACELVIPAELVLLTRARLPRGSKQKMRQLLPYAIEDKLGGEPDAVHVAAGHTLADGQTALAVIDKAWLARALARLNEAGLRPRNAWPETLLPALPADGWTMVWDGRGGFLRSGGRRARARRSSSGSRPRRCVEPGALGGRAADRLPAPAKARRRPTRGIFTRSMAVEVGVEWAPLQHPDTPSGGVDLLQGAFASSSLARDWWPNLRLPLILAGLIALLQVGATTTEWLLLSREKQQLQAAMERSFREAFPDARVVVDAPLQMQRNLAELRGAAGQLSPLDFLPLLARAAAALDADDRSNLRAVRYESSQLSLDVALPDRAAADVLLKRLTDAGLASQLQNVSGAAPQSLARIVITGNTP
jgi:general secretion pathway protein L